MNFSRPNKKYLICNLNFEYVYKYQIYLYPNKSNSSWNHLGLNDPFSKIAYSTNKISEANKAIKMLQTYYRDEYFFIIDGLEALKIYVHT